MMKQNVKTDFIKITGLDNIPEGQPIKSYNEEFYNSLSEIKMINVPIEKDNRLFYQFEHNENASVSTSAGQILVK
jgi:hypothetical protein